MDNNYGKEHRKTHLTVTMETKTITTLVDPKYNTTVLAGIAALRQQDILCDFTLKVDDKHFPVHRVLLAAVSDYFGAVFRSGMVEVHKDSMELKGVTPRGLAAILDFIYSGEMYLSESNIMDVLSAASHLQVASALNLCSKFYVQMLSLENVREIQNIAEAFHLPDLEAAAHAYLLKRFTKFAKTEYFKQLPLSEVCKLLRENELRCRSEYKIFKHAMGWIRYSRANREPLAANILANIRLSQMSAEELRHILRISFIKNNGLCTRVIDEALYYQEHPKDQPLLYRPINLVRSPPYLVAFGCSNTAMHSCILHNGIWHPLERALGQPRPFTLAAAAVVNNFLYVCGGQTHSTLASCLCFNPANGLWMKIGSMTKPRRNFALVAQGRYLYAIGGVSQNDEVIPDVEKYSIENNRWYPGPRLPHEAADVAACTLDSTIYVAGGSDENYLHLKEFHTFNTQIGEKWQKKSDLLEIKFRPAMMAHDQHLYLADLYRTEGRRAELEQYTLTTGQWTRINLPDLQFTRSFSAAMIGDWIYFVGKNHVDDGPSKRYNVKSARMENIKSYPWDIEAPLCVVLNLPDKLLLRKMLTKYDFSRGQS